MSQQLPVLVIGAGPTGLVAAISLTRSGIPVRVIEKRDTFHGGVRGTGLMPRTLEALSFLGVVDEVMDISIQPKSFAFYGPDGRTPKLAPWSEGCGDAQFYPFPESRAVSQAEFEEALRAHLQRLGVCVEISSELVDFEQFEDKVSARVRRVSDGETSPGLEETVECFAMIAADGARGRTRRQLDIPFIGQTKEEDRILTGNAYIPNLNKDHWHMWGNMKQKAFGLKPLKTENLFQIQALGPELPHIPLDVDHVRKLFYSISGRDDIVIDDAQWVSEWRANIRMCEKFSVGRVFLIGDAAHCHSPFGGQGMNSGMQDAVNLTWKLAMVYHGQASMGLMETYSEERVPVIAEMLSLSSALHFKAFGKPGASALDGAVGGAASRENRQVDNAEIMRRPKTLLQLGVNYRWSPVVLETRSASITASSDDVKKDPYGEGSDKLRAGDRAPDAKMSVVRLTDRTTQPTTLHHHFNMLKHALFVFTSSTAALERVGEELKTVVPDFVDSGLTSLEIILPKATEISAPLPSPVADLANNEKLALLIDEEAEARRVYDLSYVDDEVTYVAIRPDGVVGAFSGGVLGMQRYFETLILGGRN